MSIYFIPYINRFIPFGSFDRFQDHFPPEEMSSKDPVRLVLADPLSLFILANLRKRILSVIAQRPENWRKFNGGKESSTLNLTKLSKELGVGGGPRSKEI